MRTNSAAVVLLVALLTTACADETTPQATIDATTTTTATSPDQSVSAPEAEPGGDDSSSVEPVEPTPAAPSTSQPAQPAPAAGGTATCDDPAGDPEDGNYERDPDPDRGLDLTGAVLTVADNGSVTFTWQMAASPPPDYTTLDEFGDADVAFWAIDVWVDDNDNWGRYGIAQTRTNRIVEFQAFDMNDPVFEELSLPVLVDGNTLSVTVPADRLHRPMPADATWHALTEYGPYPEYLDVCPDAAEHDYSAGVAVPTG